MISKLPAWVLAGGWALAFIAGIVNVVGLLGFEHQAISHLTGTTSMLAAALAARDFSAAGRLAAVIGSFLAGTVLSGFVIQDSTLQLGRRYGVALLLESVLLCVSVPLFEHRNVCGVYSAACACGLQNAMVSTYSGAVVRTRTFPGCSPIWASFWAMRYVACRWTPDACGFATLLPPDFSAAALVGPLLSAVSATPRFSSQVDSPR